MLKLTHKYWRGAESHATFVVPTKIFENVIHHIGEQSIKKKKTVKDEKASLSRTTEIVYGNSDFNAQINRFALDNHLRKWRLIFVRSEPSHLQLIPSLETFLERMSSLETLL